MPLSEISAFDHGVDFAEYHMSLGVCLVAPRSPK